MSQLNRKEQILEMLQQEPDDAFLLYGLAMEHLSLNEEAQAEKVFIELLGRHPDYPPGYLQLGQLQVRMCHEDKARETYRRGIAAARQAGDAHAAGEMESFLNLIDE